MAAFRLEEDVGVDDRNAEDDRGFFHGFSLAAVDVKTWVLMALLSGIVSSASVTNFFPTVVCSSPATAKLSIRADQKSLKLIVIV